MHLHSDSPDHAGGSLTTDNGDDPPKELIELRRLLNSFFKISDQSIRRSLVKWIEQLAAETGEESKK
jgi:hypothetical protein